jgi:diguanylate cyclase (GGDEF)-like protein
MMSARRRGDTVARIGGEEFAVIMPETELADAVRAAERLRSTVAALRFDFDRGHAAPFSITLSVGAAATQAGEAGEFTELHRLADGAMYRAKRAGRNCVATQELALIPPGATPVISG